MEWTKETIVRLRDLWVEGHSTAEIGRRIGVTKNAVVGKAHRLSLPSRPSPIRRAVGQAAPRSVSRRVSGPTLPPLAASNVVPLSQDLTRTVAIKSTATQVTPPPARSGLRVTTCCWPIGEPGTRDFRFCDGDAAQGKPYCRDHAQIAYVKVRDRREQVA